MLTTTQKLYKAYGIIFKSDLPLPELLEIDAVEKSIVPEVIVKVEDLTKQWKEWSSPTEEPVVGKNFIMFNRRNIAIFLIQNGTQIAISPYPGSDLTKIKLFLLSTCMAGLLLQRKILPLHGSAVAIEGKVYAIVGKSGAGKSTLAKAFSDMGYPLLSDDIIGVTLDEDNTPTVLPSFPFQRLWQETLNEFGLETEPFEPIYNGKLIKNDSVIERTKFGIPINNYFNSTLPLGGIFELSKFDSESIVEEPIHNLNKVRTLYYHTFRRSFIPDSGLMDWHFSTTTKVANEVNMFQLKRPQNGFTANKLAQLIIKTIKKENPHD
ncbi:ATP-binding cassette domain-containing protein [Bacillus pinisoli]|uniref:ATP-binding cassette domain-containing protein n=1 Tax=Bacillus pinisoli TaxID=2901866 RepID=UPI001FF316BE|nr:ATP-binding cassette domain-containing protein [Bacillus pinisoli]